MALTLTNGGAGLIVSSLNNEAIGHYPHRLVSLPEISSPELYMAPVIKHEIGTRSRNKWAFSQVTLFRLQIVAVALLHLALVKSRFSELATLFRTFH